MSEKRLLYVSAHPIDANDGPMLHIHATCRELAALGLGVTLLGPAANAPQIAGVKVEPIALGSGRKIRAALAAKCAALLATAEFAGVYMRGSIAKVAAATQSAQLPLIVEYNGVLMDEMAGGFSLRRSFYRRSESEVAEIADHAVAVDDSIGERMAELYPESGLGEKLVTVPNGAEVAAFSAGLAARAGDDFSAPPARLVFVGALQPWTQLTRAFAALTRLPKRYHLTVIGDGPERARFEALAQEAKVPVTFLGRMPHAQLAQELSCFDIGINPDAGRRSSPLKVPEYLAAGLSVVSCGPPSLKFLRDQGLGEWLEGAPEASSFALAIERVSDQARYTFAERQWRSNWALEHRSWAASGGLLYRHLAEWLSL